MLNSKLNIAGLRVSDSITEEESTDEGNPIISNHTLQHANHSGQSHVTKQSTHSEPISTQMNVNTDRMTENRTTHNTENENREIQSENESRHIFDSDTDILDNQTKIARNYSLMPVDFEEQGEPKIIDIVQRRRDSQNARNANRTRVELELDGGEMKPKVEIRQIQCPLRIRERRLTQFSSNNNYSCTITPSQVGFLSMKYKQQNKKINTVTIDLNTVRFVIQSY